MSDLIVPDEAKGIHGRLEDPDRVARKHGWSVLGWTGLFIAVVSGIDLVLGFFPMALSNADWRLSVATRMATGLLMPSVGLALGLAAATSLRRHHTVRAASLTFAVLAAITALAGYYVLSASPAILDNAGTPAVLELAQQTLTRAAVQSVVYTAGFAVMAGIGWRTT